MSKFIEFDRHRLKRIIAVSLILSVSLIAMMLNYFGIATEDGVYLTNFIATLAYFASWILFMSYAGMKGIRSLLIFSRVWCIISLVTLVFSAVATVASLSVEGVLGMIVNIIVTLWAVPTYGMHLIIGSRIVLICLAFMIMLGLCFVPEIAVKLRCRHMIRKELDFKDSKTSKKKASK